MKGREDMDVTSSSRPALVARAQAILLRPSAEWRTIETEKTDTATLYKSYIAPIAAIGPIATFIGTTVFGQSIPFVGTVRVAVPTALVQAVISFAFALLAPYVLAFIIDALAPTFGATANRGQALKVAAYSSTASWLAGIFALVPALSILGLLGLYSLYLLYLGLPVLMKAPAEKAVTYTAACVVAAIVIFLVLGFIAGSIAALV